VVRKLSTVAGLLMSGFCVAQVPLETREEALTNCDELAGIMAPVPPKCRPYEFAKAVIASLWYANKAKNHRDRCCKS
jgi:hypothetical protein